MYVVCWQKWLGRVMDFHRQHRRSIQRESSEWKWKKWVCKKAKRRRLINDALNLNFRLRLRLRLSLERRTRKNTPDELEHYEICKKTAAAKHERCEWKKLIAFSSLQLIVIVVGVCRLRKLWNCHRERKGSSSHLLVFYDQLSPRYMELLKTCRNQSSQPIFWLH